jgi:tetratricopeptide (TPR) repeat protein
MNDLDESIRMARLALDATSPHDTERSARLSVLSLVLAARFRRTERLKDLDEAVDLARKAVAAAPPGRPDHPGLQSNLSVVLLDRVDATDGEDDLDEAAAAARSALAGLPAASPDRARYVSNLANALRARHTHHDDRAALDACVDLLREASKATGPGHPEHASILSNLAAALQQRHGALGQATDRAEGIACWQRAAEATSAPVWVRLRAAAECARWAWASGKQATAAQAGLLAVGLLPQLAWHGLARDSQEELVGTWSGLASQAAASAVAVGSPETGVQALEQGRAVLWTQFLQQRSPLTDLAAEHGGLAARLTRVRDQVDLANGRAPK